MRRLRQDPPERVAREEVDWEGSTRPQGRAVLAIRTEPPKPGSLRHRPKSEETDDTLGKRGMNLENYLPVLLFILVGIAVGAGPLLIGRLLGPHNPDPEKLSPYECGFEAFEDARMQFDVRYYLVAILFILFDLEVAFLFPWAVSLDAIGFFGFLSMMIFLGILVVGFVYEWSKGALDWE
jgi:NADH-quinone oxidoreductase subunit A